MVDAVLAQDVARLREHNGPAGTLSYAIPGRFQTYGAIELTDKIDATEDALLRALAPDPASELIAGWIDRGP